MKRSAAFTLIELLVVITLIAVLAGLILTAVGNMRKVSEREAGASQLRQVGIAIGAYVAENDGFMPGPMWPGQIPVYDSGEPGEQGKGRLAYHLAPYLGIDDPAVGDDIDILIPPAFREWSEANPSVNLPRTYVLNFLVESNGEIINPWGSLVADPPTEPKLRATVPGNAWAMTDADQQNPRVASAPWRTSTPEDIIHGDNRLALTFSGSVQRIEADELAVP